MKDLDKQIRQLASEIQAVERMLVETCGMTPVTAGIATGFGPAWSGWLRSWYQRACRPITLFPESSDMFVVRAPQPD